jgi:hypothetical protein
MADQSEEFVSEEWTNQSEHRYVLVPCAFSATGCGSIYLMMLAYHDLTIGAASVQSLFRDNFNSTHFQSEYQS